MKRTVQIVALLTALAATTAFAQVDGRTAFWNGIIASHSHSDWQTRSGTTPLALLITRLTDTNANFTHRWMVGTNGLCRLWRESLIAIQGDFRRQLSEQDMVALTQALTTLPPSMDQTPTNRLVLISFRRDGEWETRKYDRDDLPKQVGTLLSQIEEMTKPKKSPEPQGGGYSPPAVRSSTPTP